jgi:hypothetical protein
MSNCLRPPFPHVDRCVVEMNFVEARFMGQFDMVPG